MIADKKSSGGPDFICIGGQKCGTRWLYDQLGFHDEIWMPVFKELHYFNGNFKHDRAKNHLKRITEDRERYERLRTERNYHPMVEQDIAFLKHATTWDERADNYEWYKTLFEPKGDLLTGDITPAYSTLSEEIVQDMAIALPDTKFILLVRDPIERVWSAFCYGLRKHLFRLKLQPNEVDGLRRFLMEDSVKKRSMLSEIYNIWSTHVPKNRFHVEFFDDIKLEPEAVFARIGRFIGLSNSMRTNIPPDFNRKTSREKFAMTDAQRQFLSDAFRDELIACRDIWGGHCEHWCSNYGIE